MALLSTNTPIISNNPKQIAASAAGTAVVYTVPTGRKFVGYFNGTIVTINAIGINGSITGQLHTFLAGTVLANNYVSAGASVIGIETDA